MDVEARLEQNLGAAQRERERGRVKRRESERARTQAEQRRNRRLELERRLVQEKRGRRVPAVAGGSGSRRREGPGRPDLLGSTVLKGHGLPLEDLRGLERMSMMPQRRLS